MLANLFFSLLTKFHPQIDDIPIILITLEIPSSFGINFHFLRYCILDTLDILDR